MSVVIEDWRPDTHRANLIGIQERVDEKGNLRAWVYLKESDDREGIERYYWSVYNPDGTIFMSTEKTGDEPTPYVDEAMSRADEFLGFQAMQEGIRPDIVETLNKACAERNLTDAYAALEVLADWDEQKNGRRAEWTLKVILSSDGPVMRAYVNGLRFTRL